MGLEEEVRSHILNNLTSITSDEVDKFFQNTKQIVNEKVDSINQSKWTTAYHYKLRELMANLPLVSERNISLVDLPHLDSIELNPKLWSAYLKRNQAEINNAIQGDVVSTTQLYKCGRCKQQKCTYTWSQTRSADEGVTMMFRCTNCGLRWTINN